MHMPRTGYIFLGVQALLDLAWPPSRLGAGPS